MFSYCVSGNLDVGAVIQGEGRRKMKLGSPILAHPLKGRPKSAEHRAKLSAALKGRKAGPFSDEHRANLSKAKRNQSAETRRKIAETNRGRKHTPEARRKMREAKKGKPWTDEQRRRQAEARPVRVKGYLFAHKTLREVRGEAPEHPCAVCGLVAQGWALDHGFPFEVDHLGRKYSLDQDAYDPLCRSCHVRADRWRGGYRRNS
jgi:5-methylcytosine-specific restriction endonuclease McrA